MANTSSAKGNPASKRMMNPNNTRKRAANKARNDRERASHAKCESSHQPDRKLLVGSKDGARTITRRGVTCPTQPSKPRARKAKKSHPVSDFHKYMVTIQKLILGDDYYV